MAGPIKLPGVGAGLVMSNQIAPEAEHASDIVSDAPGHVEPVDDFRAGEVSGALKRRSMTRRTLHGGRQEYQDLKHSVVALLSAFDASAADRTAFSRALNRMADCLADVIS